ncbi:MAG: glycine cleavage system protein T, partial [Desulfobacteraceae bacterium]
GLFDISHMGRFDISGADATAYLQYCLTNNAAALEPGMSQYTFIADPQGGAVDDAYLYRFFDDRYLLVVNAANSVKDWEHLSRQAENFTDVRLEDLTREVAMLSLQGPQSKQILGNIIGSHALPDPLRNCLSVAEYRQAELWVARTGYTGEPLCFELFLPAVKALSMWNALQHAGAQPVGLGARDTLRLEAGLPLYGHELGQDPEGDRIPIFALAQARLAVSFAPQKGDYLGKSSLKRQYASLKAILDGRPEQAPDLPRRVRPFELLDKGIARSGARVFYQDQPVGYVTSGTMVPQIQFEGRGLEGVLSDDTSRRAIGLALIDNHIPDGARVVIDVRGKQLAAGVMPYLLRGEAPPFARPITFDNYIRDAFDDIGPAPDAADAQHWVRRTIENTIWRQQECINLIPSEQTASRVVRMLSIMDPAGRYAEHKPVKAFNESEIFYYQGTRFIATVERELVNQLRTYLGCRQVETRPVSGQMANMVVFSALVDYLNRTDRRSEQRRIRQVMNHHIIRGGHLSAQPMGALRDFVMRDPRTERPAVVNFPVLPDNPYQVDLDACEALLQRHRPELIILGKSMTLHKEPVAQMRRIIDALDLDCMLMYDMAHVLGLAGPHFQRPFAEGADLVTGSTHKTFFGTQRGIVALNLDPEADLEFWEAISRRAFPGSVSNHHLGTLLGLLVAAMELNAFKDAYQKQVVANAKALARALADTGLDVAGDPAIDYTETHQVIVKVGYAKGPEIARALEANHIICNYQAAPEEEGFTASGALRLGVAEMTRFGMQATDFQALAQLMADVIRDQKQVRQKVVDLRRNFLQMQYCFSEKDFDGLLEQLQALI